jgi:hypothetical protein
MDPHEMMHHGPGWFGFWHAGFPGLFWLVMPALFLLPWLALLAVLLWSSRHALLDRFGMGPAGSAASLRGQRYTHDALGGASGQRMRDERGRGDYGGDSPQTDDIPATDAPEETFWPRPDAPIDWS